MTRKIPRRIPLAIIAAIALATSSGIAAPLPPLIDFQSVLLDEGGNLLPSGATAIQFQILDENRTPIYTESQSIDVVKGAASALIGNGTDTKGISTGGIPDDIFATGAPRYLQVQVAGHAAEDPMTIVPVPYAQWSQTCATVSDGGVTPASIAKAAVGFESLAPDVVSKLAEALSKSQGVVTMQALNSTGGATQVGVDAKFINSGSSSVQGALQDIDLAVKKRQEETTFLTGKVNEEVTNRTNSMAGVQSKLDQETKDRGVSDTVLQNQITPIQNTLQDINNISGVLSLSKVQTSSPPPSDLNMGGHLITNLAEPTTNTDASTKKYVDNAIAVVNANLESANAANNKALEESKIGTAKIATGTYVGNGNSPKLVTQIGFKPRILFISGNNPGPFNVFSTTYLGVNQSGTEMTSTHGFNNSGGITGNDIVKMRTDGFDIASGDPNWNQNGMTYSYTAIGQQ